MPLITGLGYFLFVPPEKLNLAPIAAFKNWLLDINTNSIRLGDNLPKTRGGKIMRRLLRSVARGEAITQDTSTLGNPAVLDQLVPSN